MKVQHHLNELIFLFLIILVRQLKNIDNLFEEKQNVIIAILNT